MVKSPIFDMYSHTHSCIDSPPTVTTAMLGMTLQGRAYVIEA